MHENIETVPNLSIFPQFIHKSKLRPNVEPKPTFVAPTFSPLPLSTPAGPSRKREQHRLSDLRFVYIFQWVLEA